MSRIAYVNGSYRPHAQAAVHIEDRGLQFADSVYEVIAVVDGLMVDEQRHLERLERSLAELRIRPPMAPGPLRHILREVVRRNGVRRGSVYLQITRGVARRDHAFPAAAVPSLIVTAKHLSPPPAKLLDEGVSVITVADLRWKRCDIKTTGLLPNVLAKQQAREVGAYDALLVDGHGNVTEGTASNAWIVTADGHLVTRPLSTDILPGVTRLAILDVARAQGLTPIERPFSVAEARAAREVFLTGTTSMILPVVRIDGVRIGDGSPGPLTRALRTAYERAIAEGRIR